MGKKISNKQLQANRKNAKLGGVKTNNGKNISKYNAITHGILRRLLTDYEKGIYKDLGANLSATYPPQDFIDVILIERVIVNYIRLFRSSRAEKEQIKEELNPRITKTEDILPVMLKTTVVQEGYTPKISRSKLENINKTIFRYERSAERALFRAIRELERRKNSRKKKLNSINNNLEKTD